MLSLCWSPYTCGDSWYPKGIVVHLWCVISCVSSHCKPQLPAKCFRGARIDASYLCKLLSEVCTCYVRLARARPTGIMGHHCMCTVACLLCLRQVPVRLCITGCPLCHLSRKFWITLCPEPSSSPCQHIFSILRGAIANVSS